MTPWGALSLVLAVIAIPGLAIGFRLLGRPGGNEAALVVELGMFVLTGLMMWVAHVKERKSWAELGLARPALGSTAMLTLLGLAATAAIIFACLGAFSVVGIKFGQGDGTERPMGLMAVMIIRAGTVEELSFRSIAIDHMAAFTRSRTMGWLLPLLIFGGLHFSQGIGGVILATALGGLLTALYLWKRNLWANFAIHFIVDFVPNILLPLLGLSH